MGLYFIAIGVGMIYGQYRHDGSFMRWGLSSVIPGVLMLVISEIVNRRAVDSDAIRKRAMRNGTKAMAKITKARGYLLNFRDVTRVTIMFTERQGTTRWESQTIGGNWKKDDQVKIIYSPDDLGKKGAVVINPPVKTVNRFP